MQKPDRQMKSNVVLTKYGDDADGDAEGGAGAGVDLVSCSMWHEPSEQGPPALALAQPRSGTASHLALARSRYFSSRVELQSKASAYSMWIL